MNIPIYLKLLCLLAGVDAIAISFPDNINLDDLDGTNGFVVIGDKFSYLFGRSVGHVGDINNDGLDDVITCAPEAEPSNIGNEGACYVVFGRNGIIESTLELTSLDGSNGFVINGEGGGDQLATSAGFAGDVEGDGIDDIVISTPYTNLNFPSNSNAGTAYIIYGKNDGFTGVYDLSLIDGNNGIVINGSTPNDFLGFSAGYAGDLNADGLDDVFIGAPGVSGSGVVYVMFGDANGFSSPFDVTTLNGTNGFVINAVSSGDSTGITTSQAGDFNGDGIDDLIIGANTASPNTNSQAGACYVVFGKTDGFNNIFELSSINGENGFVIYGSSPTQRLCEKLSHAGDINSDGKDDIIIGSRLFGGANYVIYGTDEPYKLPVALSTINGTNGFTINAPWTGAGSSLSHAGDINADGIDDLIVGGAINNASYVLYGGSDTFPHPFELSSLNGMNGFVILGGDANSVSGEAVSFAGDTNGDGIDDLIIGDSGFDAVGIRGSSHVIYGKKADIIFKNNFEQDFVFVCSGTKMENGH